MRGGDAAWLRLELSGRCRFFDCADEFLDAIEISVFRFLFRVENRGGRWVCGDR